MSEKGSAFEREMCRKLSLWWTCGEDPDVFWRQRVRKLKGRKLLQYGDVTAVKSVGKPFTRVFNVELKIGYSRKRKVKKIPWDLLEYIDHVSRKGQTAASTSTVMLSFWEQCMRDAILSSRFPLLIFQRDYRVPVACLRMHHARLFDKFYSSIEFARKIIVVTVTPCGDESVSDDLLLLRLDLFLSLMSPDEVVAIFDKKAEE